MRRVGAGRGEFKSYLALGLSLGEIKRNETLRSGRCARCTGRHPRELFEISARKFYICRVRRFPRWKVVIGDDKGKNQGLSLRRFMAAFPLEAVSQFQRASAKTLQSIAHLETNLHEREQIADIKTIQHELTQLQNSIATVNGVIENINSAYVTRTSFAPVDIRSTIKPELENILGLIEDVRGLLNPPQVNRMLQPNVIQFNDAAQELDAAARNLVAGLRSKVMIRPGLGLDLPEVEDLPTAAPSPPPISGPSEIRPGLGLDLPEVEDPPTPAPSPPPISHSSEMRPMRSRLHQMVIAGVILACLSSLVVALNGQHQADGAKRNEQVPAPNGTNSTPQETQTGTNRTDGAAQNTAQTSTGRNEQVPAQGETNGTAPDTPEISTRRAEQVPAQGETNGPAPDTPEISTKRTEQVPAQGETNGPAPDTPESSSKRAEQAPALDEAIQPNSAGVLARTSARAPRKTTLPLFAAHVRLIWSNNQAVTGNAYRTLEISSHDQCARLCRNDIRCKVTDYAKDSETCRLFGSIERSDPSANSDYALKAQ
jgi:hypothetical protein